MMTKFMNKQRGLLAAIMALVMVFAGAAFVAAEVDATDNYVAEVDGTGYGDFYTALSTATAGQTVILLKDVELNRPVFLKDVNIDGNGKILDLNTELYIDGVATIENLTIKTGPGEGMRLWIANWTDGAANISFDKVNMLNEGNWSSVYVQTGNNYRFTFTECDFGNSELEIATKDTSENYVVSIINCTNLDLGLWMNFGTPNGGDATIGSDIILQGTDIDTLYLHGHTKMIVPNGQSVKVNEVKNGWEPDSAGTNGTVTVESGGSLSVETSEIIIDANSGSSVSVSSYEYADIDAAIGALNSGVDEVTIENEKGIAIEKWYTITKGNLIIKNTNVSIKEGKDAGIIVQASLSIEASDVRVPVIVENDGEVIVTKAKKMTVTGDSTADLGVGYGNTLVLADLTVPAGKKIQAWGTVVIEGNVTVQKGAEFDVYQGGNAQIDGALIIEGIANIDGKAVVNGSVKVYNSEGGASFNVGATGEVDVVGTMDVLKGKVKETTNTLAVAASGDLIIEGTLTVTGTMSGMVCDMGTVVFNGEADKNVVTGFTVYDGVTLTIASVTGTLKITDDNIEGSDYYTNETMTEKKENYYISTGNTVTITNVKNVTVSVVLNETASKKADGTSVRLVTSEMTVTGTIASIDEKATTVDETVTVNGASADIGEVNGKAVQGTAIIGDITLGKQVQLQIGNSATLAAADTVTEDIDVVGTVNVIAEESLIVTNTCVDVTGTILVGEKTADAQKDLTVNGATYYIDDDAESDDKITYYTTFENALAAVATAYDNEVTVLGKVKVATALEIPADATILFAEKAEMTIDVDGTVTVAVGALFDASKAEKVDVDGMLIIMDKESGLEGDNKLVYQVYAEAGEVATYSGLILALRNASEGDVITVVKAGEIEKSVTIPEGVTLVVPNGSKLTIGSDDEDVTLTVAGTLKVEGTVEAADDAQEVEIAVPGTIMEIGSGDIKFDTNADGIDEIVMDDYVTFNTKVDGRATVVYSNLVYAAENATEGDVTVFGDVSAGDITFTMGEKATEFDIGFGKTGSTMTVGTMTLVSNGKADITLDTKTISGAVTGTVASAAGSVDLNKVSGITIAVSIVTDVDGTTDYMTVDETLTGSMTVATGTVTVDELSIGSSEKNVIVVETGATLVVPNLKTITVENMTPASASVKQYYGLIVDGAIVFEKGADLVDSGYIPFDNKGTEATNDDTIEELASEILINGTMTISDNTSIDILGKLFVNGTLSIVETAENETAYITVTNDLILGTTPSLGANGVLSGDVKMGTSAIVIAYAGADVSAAVIDPSADGTSKAKSTEIVINGVPYMTVYVAENADIAVSAVEEYIDAEGYSGAIDWADFEGAKIGDYATVEGTIEADYIKLTVSAGVGLQVYIDGLSIENFTNTTDDNTLGEYAIQLGTHTVSFAVQSGYDGSAATITVNGVQVANGGTFTLDVDDKSATIIASGAVPAQSGSTVVVDDADDGMALTDILLIVLVVLIVIMAIIVALRMMRS